MKNQKMENKDIGSGLENKENKDKRIMNHIYKKKLISDVGLCILI